MSIVMIILCVLLVLLGVILFRTMQFKPVPQPGVPDLPAEIDEERAVENLQKLVQCATVSYYDRTKEDEAEFAKLLDLVPQLYPHVVSACEKIDVYHRALLYRWPGKDSSEATVLMAHFDVVPVERDKWQKDPFVGIIGRRAVGPGNPGYQVHVQRHPDGRGHPAGGRLCPGT